MANSVTIKEIVDLCCGSDQFISRKNWANIKKTVEILSLERLNELEELITDEEYVDKNIVEKVSQVLTLLYDRKLELFFKKTTLGYRDPDKLAELMQETFLDANQTYLIKLICRLEDAAGDGNLAEMTEEQIKKRAIYHYLAARACFAYAIKSWE